MNFDDNITKIILAVISLAVAGGVITLVRIKVKKNNANKVSQNNNTVSKGDIVGRDKITK